MDKETLTMTTITAYGRHLSSEERSSGTISKYMRDMRAFAKWLDGAPLTKETTAGWKAYLLSRGYAPVTVNSMLAALNGMCRFLGKENCRVRFLKIQRRLFRDASRELNRSEYEHLLETAKAKGWHRLALLMETIYATGIRVSELEYITVEAAQQGRAVISLKGKIRTIFLPNKLCRKLLKYAKKHKTISGKIFLTRNGTSISRHQIWAELKRLCRHAGVDASKVFPHNLRHLFATIFYRSCKDIAQLADILGHASIETTRIYLITSGEKYARQLNRLNLVS